MGAKGRLKKKVDPAKQKTETFKLKPGEAALTFTPKGLGLIVVGKGADQAASMEVILAMELYEMARTKEVQTALIMKYQQRINAAAAELEEKDNAKEDVPNNTDGETDMDEAGQVEAKTGD